MPKPGTLADVVTVAEEALESEQQLHSQGEAVQSQAERIAASSARCTSLENTIADRESSVSQLRDEFSPLQTKVAKVQSALATRANAGIFEADLVQELGRNVLRRKGSARRARGKAYPEAQGIAAAGNMQDP